MDFKFIQYTSPSKGPVGARWFPDGGKNRLCQVLLHNISQYSPANGKDILSTDFMGGVAFFPMDRVGIVFRLLNGGRDALGRDGKITINGGIFSLQEIEGRSLSGILDLAFLKDPMEENRPQKYTYVLSDYAQDTLHGSELQELYDATFRQISQNELFWIEKKENASFLIKKIYLDHKQASTVDGECKKKRDSLQHYFFKTMLFHLKIAALALLIYVAGVLTGYFFLQQKNKTACNEQQIIELVRIGPNRFKLPDNAVLIVPGGDDSK